MWRGDIDNFGQARISANLGGVKAAGSEMT
jgi:hypothetical protein